MKPREQGGVVDDRLNVYGVQGLKIAGKYYPPTLAQKKKLDTYVNLFFIKTSVSHQEM